jgi:outer membrane protein OmpA-like peptidoglycan-associated protein
LAGKTIGSAETLTHTFAQPGVAYPVGLTVTDDQAQSATTTVTVTPHTKPATVRQTVRFGLDRADLTRAARTALAPLRGLVAYATSTQITGYCAAHETSTRSTLLELSRQRAQAVASYLFAGHDRSGVSISGEGATNFVATNQTASGCAKNRRVQIQVRYPKPTL